MYLHDHRPTASDVSTDLLDSVWIHCLTTLSCTTVMCKLLDCVWSPVEPLFTNVFYCAIKSGASEAMSFYEPLCGASSCLSGRHSFARSAPVFLKWEFEEAVDAVMSLHKKLKRKRDIGSGQDPCRIQGTKVSYFTLFIAALSFPPYSCTKETESSTAERVSNS